MQCTNYTRKSDYLTIGYSFPGKDNTDDHITFYFSNVTKKLLYYAAIVGEKKHQIFETLVQKYGPPTVTLLKPSDYKWEGNGQRLYYFFGGDSVIYYINTINLEEHAAIVQKKIKEIDQSGRKKIEKAF